MSAADKVEVMNEAEGLFLSPVDHDYSVRWSIKATTYKDSNQKARANIEISVTFGDGSKAAHWDNYGIARLPKTTKDLDAAIASLRRMRLKLAKLEGALPPNITDD